MPEILITPPDRTPLFATASIPVISAQSAGGIAPSEPFVALNSGALVWAELAETTPETIRRAPPLAARRYRSPTPGTRSYRSPTPPGNVVMRAPRAGMLRSEVNDEGQ